MLMKSSTIGLALSLALLAPWAAPPAAAQDASAPASATAKKRTTRKAAKPATSTKAVKKRVPRGSTGVKAPASSEEAKATARTKKKRTRKGAVPMPASEPVMTEPAEAPTALEAAPAAVEQAPATVATPAPTAPPEEKPSSVVLSGDERPWARGISQQKQQVAIDLFRSANALLKESIFAKAAEQYREALTHWDHPAIHYNLALALLNLDQPIEVHEHLEAAMRFGAAPLDTEKLESARAYKTLVEKQLARLEITCETPGASVMMDGRQLFVGPGRFEGWVRAGPHTLVATGEGFLTQDQSRTLSPGERASLDLKLFTSEDLIEYRRKWSAWKPWTVVGSGVAIAAGGILMHSMARKDYTSFDTAIASCGGCVPEPAVARQRSRGDTLQTGAVAAYAVGGAAVVTGAVLVYLNRLQPHQIDQPSATPKVTASVTPYLGAGGGGASATLRF
ncbi:hypothetical protein ACLESO_17025 [Pyxidicoccus sp. 3LG]